MGFSVIEGDVRATPVPDESVLWEDNFTNGPSGWVQIMSSSRPFGMISLDPAITHKGSRWSLRLDTEDFANGTNAPNWARCMALKRLWRGNWMRIVRAEWVFAYGSRWGGDGEESMSPRDIRFGLDNCDFTGARRFFGLRYQISGETNSTEGATRHERWQVQSATVGNWVTIPALGDGVRPLAVNENKRNLFRVELEIDLENGVYNGVSINGDGFGSLAANSDTSISSIPGPQLETLDSFRGCLNPTFTIENRIYGPVADGNATACWANLVYSRGRAFA